VGSGERNSSSIWPKSILHHMKKVCTDLVSPGCSIMSLEAPGVHYDMVRNI
jgi:hypothetical protein